MASLDSELLDIEAGPKASWSVLARGLIVGLWDFLKEFWLDEFGGGGGSGSTNTTVEKADPWEGQQPYLLGTEGQTGIFPEAERLYNEQNLQFFPGQTFAPLAPESQAALGMQTQRAMQGSPLTQGMQSELGDVLSGKYTDPNTNPHLMPMADQITAKVLPQINARFAASGRSDSGLAARAASEGVTDALASAAEKNYQAERNRQMQAMLFAPQAAQADYFDTAKLAEVGGSGKTWHNRASTSRCSGSSSRTWPRGISLAFITNSFRETTGEPQPARQLLRADRWGRTCSRARSGVLASVTPGANYSHRLPQTSDYPAANPLSTVAWPGA